MSVRGANHRLAVRLEPNGYTQRGELRREIEWSIAAGIICRGNEFNTVHDRVLTLPVTSSS